MNLSLQSGRRTARLAGLFIPLALLTMGAQGNCAFSLAGVVDVTSTDGGDDADGNSIVQLCDFRGGCDSGSPLPDAGSAGSSDGGVGALGLQVIVSPATFAPGGFGVAHAVVQWSDGSTSDVTQDATWNVSDWTVVGIPSASNTWEVTGVAYGTAIVTASDDGVSGSATVTVANPQPQALVLSPSATSVAPGAQMNVDATVIYSDGNAHDVTSEATWSSSDETVAIVAGGTVEGIGLGSFQVTATYTGLTNSVLLSVAESTDSPVGIVAAPSTVAVLAGETQQLSVTATLLDGTMVDVTNEVAWTTGDATVAAVSAAGLMTATGGGATTLTAALGALSASISVTVNGLASFSVNATRLSVAVGQTKQLAATAVDDTSVSTNVTDVATWSSSNPAVATVAEGLITAVSLGTATVTAKLGSLQATVAVTVTPAVPLTILVTVPQQALPERLTVQADAQAIYSDSSIQDISATATWTSSDTAGTIASVSSLGVVTTIGEGTATLTASTGGVSGTVAITVVAALSTFAVEFPSLSLPVGLSEPGTVIATLADATTLDVTALFGLAVQPEYAAYATLDSDDYLTGISPGTATIGVALSTERGTARVTVTDPLASVSVSPSAPYLAVGTTQQLDVPGVLTTGDPLDVTALATWASSDQTGQIAMISTSGLVTAVGAGTATMTATVGTLTATAEVTVAP